MTGFWRELVAFSSGSSFLAPLSCCIPHLPCTNLSNTQFMGLSTLIKWAGKLALNSTAGFQGRRWLNSFTLQGEFWQPLWPKPFISFWFWIWLIRSIQSVSCSWQRIHTRLEHRIPRCCTWQWLWACMGCHFYFTGFILWVQLKPRPLQWSQGTKRFCQRKCSFCWYRRSILFNWGLSSNFKEIWNFHLLALLFPPLPSTLPLILLLFAFPPSVDLCSCLPSLPLHSHSHLSIKLLFHFLPQPPSF